MASQAYMQNRVPLRLAVAAFCLALSATGAVVAQKDHPDASRVALAGEIAALIKESNLGNKLGIAIADTRSGRFIFAHNAETPLNPASNMKLLTAAAALWELGPDFCMRTGVYGEVQENAVVGGAYLKGFGDPTLRWTDLVEMAQQLTDLGIRSVDEVVVDGSYFDGQVLPPAFDQHPEEASPFRAPVAAVAVDRSSYVLTVRPGPTAGTPALVQLLAPGYFELDNGLTTSKEGRPGVMAVQRKKAGKSALTLRGTVPLGTANLSYRRSVEDPLVYSGYVFIEALKSMRIRAPLRVRIAAAPPGKPLLASQRSVPLAELMAAMGKHSDNFVAEMVFKVLGAEVKRRPGRSADGASVIKAALKRLGIPVDKVAIVNGSGLYNGNLVPASAFTKVLLAAYKDPAIGPEYLAHLAVGGSDGTLTNRLRDLPAPRILRAKTGTLDDVVALSGYLLGPNPDRAVAFSFLANNVRGEQQAAKKLADDVVRAVARYLWK